MSGTLRGNAVLITGASAGIGWACAVALAREGADLVITARRGERLAALVRELEPTGARVATVAGDARDEQTAIDAVAVARAQFGRLDILVNNAGVGIYKNIVDTSAAEYDHLVNSNVRSTFLFTRHAVPVMIEQKRGTIVMISSMAGKYGFAGEAVYCATKFAQVGLAQALDQELRPHGIKVGAICPGGVKTEFAIGTGRTEAGVAASTMLEPQDVARAVVLACTQAPGARIIEIQMRTMSEGLT
jgi:3-oxoacyl-[acyl-carrier protein] reductase